MTDKRPCGGVSADTPVWLAPLAGVTTRTFRDFHRKLGAGLVHTEMVSAIGLSRKNRKTADLLGDDTEAGPIVLQLFAPDAETLMRGAELAVGARRFDALEINMACPMPKVTKKGSGSRLIERPEVAAEMTRRLRTLGLPAWVKTRICDPKRHPLTTRDFCALLSNAGADLLILHGRTPAQRYTGHADKEIVAETARQLSVPVVASGDYYTPDDARAYLNGGCAGVLAARGVLRDVFLIPKTLAALGRDVPERQLTPGAADQIDALVELGRAGVAREGESFTLVLIRRMLAGLLKGFPGVSAIRQACASYKKWEDFEANLLKLRETLERTVPGDRGIRSEGAPRKAL